MRAQHTCVKNSPCVASCPEEQHNLLQLFQRHSPSGMLLRIPSSYFLSMAAVMSLAMKPGATALQVMLRPAYSLATVLVRPSTPALAAE
jgi:hypothetical protein